MRLIAVALLLNTSVLGLHMWPDVYGRFCEMTKLYNTTIVRADDADFQYNFPWEVIGEHEIGNLRIDLSEATVWQNADCSYPNLCMGQSITLEYRGSPQ